MAGGEVGGEVSNAFVGRRERGGEDGGSERKSENQLLLAAAGGLELDGVDRKEGARDCSVLHCFVGVGEGER